MHYIYPKPLRPIQHYFPHWWLRIPTTGNPALIQMPAIYPISLSSISTIYSTPTVESDSTILSIPHSWVRFGGGRYSNTPNVIFCVVWYWSKPTKPWTRDHLRNCRSTAKVKVFDEKRKTKSITSYHYPLKWKAKQTWTCTILCMLIQIRLLRYTNVCIWVMNTKQTSPKYKQFITTLTIKCIWPHLGY